MVPRGSTLRFELLPGSAMERLPSDEIVSSPIPPFGERLASFAGPPSPPEPGAPPPAKRVMIPSGPMRRTCRVAAGRPAERIPSARYTLPSRPVARPRIIETVAWAAGPPSPSVLWHTTVPAAVRHDPIAANATQPAAAPAQAGVL